MAEITPKNITCLHSTSSSYLQLIAQESIYNHKEIYVSRKVEIVNCDIYANYIKLKILYLAFRNENNFRQNLLHGYICKRCADYFVIFCHICTGTGCSYKVLWQ